MALKVTVTRKAPDIFSLPEQEIFESVEELDEYLEAMLR